MLLRVFTTLHDTNHISIAGEIRYNNPLRLTLIHFPEEVSIVRDQELFELRRKVLYIRTSSEYSCGGGESAKFSPSRIIGAAESSVGINVKVKIGPLHLRPS